MVQIEGIDPNVRFHQKNIQICNGFITHGHSKINAYTRNSYSRAKNSIYDAIYRIWQSLFFVARCRGLGMPLGAPETALNMAIRGVMVVLVSSICTHMHQTKLFL